MDAAAMKRATADRSVGRTSFVNLSVVSLPVARPNIWVDSRGNISSFPMRWPLASDQIVMFRGGPLPLVLLLAACGGGGGGGGGPVASAPPPAAEPERMVDLSGSLYDGPIEGAPVYVDVNENREVDNEDYLVDDATDSEGGFAGSIPGHLQHLPLIAKNTGATHHHQGNVALPDFFVAPAGSGVISPLTHIIELDVVSRSEITEHVLFSRFQPFNHNPYEEGANHVFGNRIKEFLPELTALIASTPDIEALRIKVRALLDKYLRKFREWDQLTTLETPDKGAEDPDPPKLQINAVRDRDLAVDENSAPPPPKPAAPPTQLASAPAATPSPPPPKPAAPPTPPASAPAATPAAEPDLGAKGLELLDRNAGKLIERDKTTSSDVTEEETEDVNEAPTVSIDGSQTLTLYEGLSVTADTGYTVSATDPDAGDAVTFSVRDDKGFEVKGGKLRVKDGQSFDFETKPSIDLIIIGTDRGGLTDTQTVTINVTNTNDSPLTWDALADVSVAEGVRDTGLTVTTARKNDAAGEEASYEIVDAAMRKIFRINDDGILQFRDAPDHDDDNSPNSYEVVIRATSLPVRDGGITQTAEQTVRVEVTNLLDESLTINAVTDLAVAENSTTLRGSAQLGITTRERGAHEVEYRLAGGVADKFVAVTPDGVISLKQAPNHESTQTINFAVEVRYVRAGQDGEEGWQGHRDVKLNVIDVNEAPTGFEFDVIEDSLDENTPTTARTALARLMVSDPDRVAAFRQHRFSLPDKDTSLFEVDDGVLYLKAGVVLDAEAATSHQETVSLDGTGRFLDFTLTVINLYDTEPRIAPVTDIKVKENTHGIIHRPILDRKDIGVTKTVWTLSGLDEGWFRIDEATGAIRFNSPPNYETPDDNGANNRYDITLGVTTSYGNGNQDSDRQRLVIEVEDRPATLEGGENIGINIEENTSEGFRLSYSETEGAEVEFSLSGLDAALFQIVRIDAAAVDLGFREPPDYENPKGHGINLDGNLYNVDVTMTATWAANDRQQIEKKSVWVTVLDAPEAPVIKVTPDPPDPSVSEFYVLATAQSGQYEKSGRHDTGYSVAASDDDGDEVTFRLSDNPRFRVKHDKIWVKRGYEFGNDGETQVTLLLKAVDNSPERKHSKLELVIPVKQRLDDINDMLRIDGERAVDVKENLDIGLRPTLVWGEGYRSNMVVWSLDGADARLLTIDPTTGIVSFITPPDFESNKKVYEFTLKVAAIGGQLVNQKEVTINIEDVDDAPSGMRIINIHDDAAFTQEELNVPANRKLARINFTDVDSQAGNDVEIDSASRALFEVRAARQAHKDGVYQLWLKNGVTLEAGSYTITITAVINGVRHDDMQQTFTFTVTAGTVESPENLENPENPENLENLENLENPENPENPEKPNELNGEEPETRPVDTSNGAQFTKVLKFRELPEFEVHQSQMDNALSADVL